jgi:O-antigen/teichoic acid export membrane protein
MGLGSMALLSRILDPSDYGIVALMTSVSAIVLLAADMGLTWALVQRRELSDAQLYATNFLALQLGIAALVLCTFLGPVASHFYGVPELVAVGPFAGLGILLTNLTIVPMSLMRRRMNGRSMTVLYLASTGLGQAVALLVALWGGGYWSLIAQTTVPNAVLLISSTRASKFTPRMQWRTAAAIPIAKMGIVFAIVNVLGATQAGIEALAVGRVAEVNEVGLLSRAQFLRSIPMLYFVTVMQDLVIPGLVASREDPTRLGSLYRTNLAAIASVACPCGAAIVVFAPELAFLLLGREWAESAVLLRWMVASVVSLPLGAAAMWLFITVGGRRRMIQVAATNLVVATAVALAASRFGPIAIVASLSIATALVMIPWSMFMAHRAAALSIRATLLAISPGLGTSLFVLASGFTAEYCAQVIGCNPIVSSALKAMAVGWCGRGIIASRLRLRSGAAATPPRYPHAP